MITSDVPALREMAGDAEAVHGLQAEAFEDQHVEGALDDVGGGLGHAVSGEVAE